MAKVTDFPIRTSGRETATRILKTALKWEGVKDLIIIANINDEMCVAGTCEMQHEIVGLIEMGKHKILKDCDEGE